MRGTARPRITTSRVAAFSLALAMSLLLSAPARGQAETQPEEKVQQQRPVESDASTDTDAEKGTESETEAEIERVVEISCRDEQGRPESWLDRTHSYLTETLCEPAAWFDGFFGDSRAEEETPVGSFIRVRNSLRWDETGQWQNDVDVSANLTLPRVSERIRLLVSRGEFDSDDPERDRRDDEETRLGLRLLLSGWGQTQFDLDGTIKVGSGGLNPRARARVRHTVPMTDTAQARFTQTAFWEVDEGLGTTSRADWEWLPSDRALVRLTAAGTYSQDSEGVDWRAGLVGFRQLNRRTAIRSELGAFGYTRPAFEAEEIFVNFRFRRSFLRDWLFYELQPEYAWPLERELGPRRSDWRFYLTLEVQFENPGSKQLRAEEAEETDDPGEDEPPLDHYRGR